MIAAVWCARGSGRPDEVERRLGRWNDAAGAPRFEVRRDDCAIVGWGSANVLPDRKGASVGRFEAKNGAFFGVADDLVGNFALATLRPEGGLLLARGPLGGEPLYWAREGTTLLAASRLELLLSALDVPPAFDVPYLATLTAGLIGPGDRLSATPYLGVRRFLSCERRLWPPPTRDDAPVIWTNGYVSDPLSGDDDALADHLWSATKDSVRRSMAGARVVGVLAGGGVDSSGLLAAAVECARESGDVTVVPLAIDFEGPGDDRPHRHALEARLGTRAVTVTPEDGAPYVRGARVADASPTLYGSVPLVCAAVDAGKRHGVERILSGFLGDLILDAPKTALLARAFSGERGAALAAFGSAVRHRDPWRSTPISRVRELLIQPLLRRLVPPPIARVRRRRRLESRIAWAGPAMRDALSPFGQMSIANAPFVTTPYDRYVALATDPQMLEQIEARAQLEILTGVPFREPWMDDTFVRTIARIDPWKMDLGDQDRGLFRRAMRGHVPDSVRLRRDKAHIEPALDRMLVAAGREALTAAHAGRIASSGIVDARAFAEATRLFFAKVAASGGSEAAENELHAASATWTSLWPAWAVDLLLSGVVR